MHIGWVDFSRGDRNKVLSVLQLFAEQGAVDELGIGIVRDAFANFFFPGSSTIQTRAKYFFIVSYLLRQAADERRGLDWVTAQEHECCRELVERAKAEGRSTEGIIGSIQVDTKTWVKRKPSDIYWNGIKTLGFFNPRYSNLSMSEYLTQADRMAKVKDKLAKSSRSKSDDWEDKDDPLSLGDDYKKFWNLPANPSWRKDLRIELTADEAAFFYDTLKKYFPDSVYFALLEHWPGNELSFDGVARLVRPQVNADTQILLDYALKFDRLVYSARVAYNVIVSDRANSEAIDEWDKLVSDLPEIAEIDIDEIFFRLHIQNVRAKKFLNDLCNIYRKGGDFGAIQKLLVERECGLKGEARAKLMHPSDKDPKWIGGKHLDYRTTGVCRIINEIKSHV